MEDVLADGLRLVICGTAVGKKIAKSNSYYTDKSNKFWDVLYETGLTTSKLKSSEYRELLKFDIGLTNISKKTAGTDNQLKLKDFNVEEFYNKMLEVSPKVVGFNGKKQQ